MSTQGTAISPEKAQKTLELAQGRVAVLEETKSQLTTLIDGLKKEAVTLEHSIEYLKGKEKEAKAALSDAQGAKNAVEEECKEIDKTKEAKGVELGKLQAEESKLKASVESLTEEVEKLGNVKASQVDAVKAEEVKLKELTEKANALQEAISNLPL